MDLEFGVYGLGLRVWGAEFGVKGSGFRVQGGGCGGWGGGVACWELCEALRFDRPLLSLLEGLEFPLDSLIRGKQIFIHLLGMNFNTQMLEYY